MAEPGSSLREQYTLLTPENIELRYEVAGAGSRLIAAMIDYILLALVATALFAGGAFAAGIAREALQAAGAGRAAAALAGNVALAGVIIAWFLSWTGYFILFELLWNGQTPGKRLAGGLRVVGSGGRPVGFLASLVRNLLRLVDMTMFIGVLIMLVDRSSRRLGDLAAGTLVIREPRAPAGRLFSAAHVPEVAAPAVEAFPNAGRLTAEHYGLVRDYFARRDRLQDNEAAALARSLAAQIARSVEIEFSAIGDAVAFLAAAAAAYEARRRYRETVED